MLGVVKERAATLSGLRVWLVARGRIVAIGIGLEAETASRSGTLSGLTASTKLKPSVPALTSSAAYKTRAPVSKAAASSKAGARHSVSVALPGEC